MSVELIETHPENDRIFAFSVGGKRVVVEATQEVVDDFYGGDASFGVADDIAEELGPRAANIVANYADLAVSGRSPKFHFTTQGLKP